MDNEKIKELAQSCAEACLERYASMQDSEIAKEYSDVMETAIRTILETHCIVEKSIIKSDYADVKKAVADWESSELTERDNYFEYGRVFGNKEVLESYFSRDDLIGKETEK